MGRVKSALGVLNEAIEIASGWGFVAGALYAAMFVDFAGNGSLWTALRGLSEKDVPRASAGPSMRTVTIPYLDLRASAGADRLLIAAEPTPAETVLAALQPAPSVEGAPPKPRLASSPAFGRTRPQDGWRRSLQGELRPVAVHGRGQQPSVLAVVALPSSADAPRPGRSTVSAVAPIARRGEAAARPGVIGRVAPAAPRGEVVRNVR